MQKGLTLFEHVILAVLVGIFGLIGVFAYADFQALARLDEFVAENHVEVDKSKRLRWRVGTLKDGRRVDCKAECTFVTSTN